MLENRLFRFAIIASITVHLFILGQRFDLSSLLIPQEAPKLIEVSYKKAAKPSAGKPAPRPQGLRDEPFLNLNAKITADARLPASAAEKMVFKPPKVAPLKGPVFAKPSLIKPDIMAIKKKISLPPVDIEKMNNPSYISYYQIVREKIRRSAYQNYTRTDTGEVYLTFVISSEGYVKGVRLVEEKSSGASYLREIALQSVKDAAPFPDFPKELDYPSLTFNVVISFEIE